MKRLILVAMILFVTHFVWSEPKPYQNALMNEPLSMMDFMIYKNQLSLEEFVRDFILDSENQPIKYHPRRIYWDNADITGYKYDFFEWETPQDKSLPFIPPLSKRQTSLEFNWEDGTFDVEQQWHWNFNPHIGMDQKGRIKPSSENIAKICELQLYRMNFFYIAPTSHEGYTTSNFEKTENQYNKIQNDTHFTVHIAFFGTYATNDFTYMECKSDKKSLTNKDASKIEYSYNGDWHKLGEFAKKRSLPIK